MTPNIKIVGLGGAGANIVKAARQMLESRNIQNVEFCCYEGGVARLANTPVGESIYYSREKILSKNGEENAPTLLLLVGGLGGSFASLEIPALAMFAKKRGFDVGVFASTPFKFEGNMRSDCAKEAVNAIRAVADFHTVFENRIIVEKGMVSENMTLQQAFEKQDEWIAGALTDFVNMIFSQGDIVVDYADVRALWLRGRRNHLQYVKIEGEDGESGVSLVARKKGELEMLLKNVSSAMFLISHGPNFTMLDYSSCMESLYEFFGEDPDVIICDNMVDDIYKVMIRIFVFRE